MQIKSLLSEKKIISSEMTVLDVISKHRKTEAVFRQYDKLTGECICCRVLFDSIRNVAKKYDLDSEKFMNDLNAAANSPNQEPDRELIKGK